MATFGRTTRQGVIWDLLQDIRDEVDEGLRGPEEAVDYVEYEGGPELVDLISDWDDLVEEYGEIHTENDTKG